MRRAKAPEVISGILRLTILLYQRLAKMAAVSDEELIDYVTGNDDRWQFKATKDLDLSENEWERDVASLDSAVLALLDADTTISGLADATEVVLEKSLFARQLNKLDEDAQPLLRQFIVARASNIWRHTTAAQRRGYHAAGIGFNAGRFIDRHLRGLIDSIFKIEAGVITDNEHAVAEGAVSFAELILEIAPFRPPKGLPTNWKRALKAWIEGQASAEVVRICGDDGVDLLQEAFVYRLPWAIEAVRVHGLAVGNEDASELTGIGAMAVETGSANQSVIVLIRSGLTSREAAVAAVARTHAAFHNHDEMVEWLQSEDVKELSRSRDWPTANTRHAWLQFIEDEKNGSRREWQWRTETMRAEWTGSVPEPGTPLMIVDHNGSNVLVTPAFDVIGTLGKPFRRSRNQIVSVITSDEDGHVEIESFGPS